MPRPQAINGLVVLLVVAGVAGVAWFKSSGGLASSSVPKPSEAAKPGELCPEPTPAKSDEPAAAGPAISAGTPAAARRLPQVVDLGAGKCKACIELAPILEALKKEYAGRVDVAFIDVWKNPKAGEPYKIRVIPTQIFYTADGKEIWRHEGFLPKADFIAKFKEMGVK